MKRNFGWLNFTRVWRGVVRVLTRRRFRRKNKKQVVEKTEVVVDVSRNEPLRSVGDAATEKNARNDGVSLDKTTGCGFVGEEKSETTPGDAEIGLDRAKKSEILSKNALDETKTQKTLPDRTQVVENKSDNVAVEKEKNDENDNGDERKQNAAPLRSTEDATLKDNAQIQVQQWIREWINDEGKIVVKAALEIELSARSTEFAFFRSARGTLYRYPLRRLSLADRVWICETLGISVEIKGIVRDGLENEKSTAPAEVDSEPSATASEVVDFDEVDSEPSATAPEVVDFDEVDPEPSATASEVVDFDDVEVESSQTVLDQDVEYDDEELGLDFDVEDDAASSNALEASEAEEYDEDDATSDDLRLNFWEDWDAVADESKTEKTSFDENTQLRKLNGLNGKGERKRRKRQDVETSTKNGETRRRKETKKDARRKNEKKRNATSSGAEYYEPFSRMEPETLDGLYDYYGDLDELRDEIETERIIDYYDWTYGDARYRDDGDEWE